MNRIITLLLLFALSLPAAAQTKRIRKVVEIMPAQTFYLNGGARSMMGGISRQTFRIDLPKNTVEWYYSFTTQEGKVPSGTSIRLAAQLTRLVDPTGLTAIATAAILCPTGSNACNSYLLGDYNTAQAFLNKEDYLGNGFRYFGNFSRENFRDGTIQVKGMNYGPLYIGFKNPSPSIGVTVIFEAAAIVEEADANHEKAVNYGNLGWKAYEAGDIDKCILYSKKALELDKDLLFVKMNLGLCYLIKNDEIEAMEYYMDGLGGVRQLATSQEKKYYLQAAMDDINSALRVHLRMAGSKEVLQMYEEEMRKI